MSPTTATTRPLDRQTRRPGRPVQAAPRRPLVIRAFAAPVVRELPPRRDSGAAAGTAW